ncbi:MAG: hypothetical protein ABW034_00610 [Steroidobacteraceae bacterium]
MSPAPSFEIRKHAHEFQGVHESVIELVENELDVVAFVHREEFARPFAYAPDMLELLRRVAAGENCAGDAALLVADIDNAASSLLERSSDHRFDGMILMP